MVMNLNKSHYRLVQASLYLYNNLKVYCEARGFNPSPMDRCMLYGRGMITIIYVYEVLFFGPDKDNIYEVIK